MTQMNIQGRLTSPVSTLRSRLGIALLPVMLLLASCASTGEKQTQYEKKPINHEVTTADRAAADSHEAITTEGAVLWVNGLGCPLCATNIDSQLKRVKGVKALSVDLSVGRVKVNLVPGRQPSPHTLGEAVEDAGFTLVKIEQSPSHPELLQ